MALRAFPIFVVFVACVAPSTTGDKKKIELPPANLEYTESPFSLTVGTMFGPVVPYYDGGDADAFAITPALPDGLTFSVDTGAIVGTPTAVSPLTTYTVTASNDYGEDDVAFTILVNAAATAPSALSYAQAAPVYVVNQSIPSASPALSGTAPFTFSVMPPLPNGLSIDMTTGVISGTPTATQAATTYTITATNAKGSTTTTISIAVSATLQPPVVTGYTVANATYTQNVAIATNVPQWSGGAPATYALTPVAPATMLPAGLSFDTMNGRISGTPTAVVNPAQSFDVTATNAAGTSAAFRISIAVTAQSVPALSYPAGPFTFLTPGSKIPEIAPTALSGQSSLQIAPALPSGLSFSATTGKISGHPAGSPSNTTHTVTATNAAGSTTAMVNIVLNAAPAAAAGFSAPGGKQVLVQNVGLGQNCFGQTSVSISVGQSVEWVGDATIGIWNQRVESPIDAFPSHLFLPNDVHRVAFNDCGTFVFQNPHDVNTSKGSVIVTGCR